MNTHIIHKQKVLLNISEMDNAFTLQNRLSAVLNNDIPDILASLFDKIISPNSVLRIDLLSLDLGVVNEQNFEEEFKTGLIKQVEKEISKYKEDTNRYAHNESVVVSSGRSLADSFIYFLEHGYLPWYISSSQKNVWESDIVSKLTLWEWDTVIEWLKKNIGTKNIVQRLVHQFSDTLLEKILSITLAVNDNFRNEIYADANYLLTKLPAQNKNLQRNKLWEFFLTSSLVNEPAKNLRNDFLDLIIYNLNETTHNIIVEEKIKIMADLKTAFTKNIFYNIAQFLTVKRINNEILNIDFTAADIIKELAKHDDQLVKENNISVYEIDGVKNAKTKNDHNKKNKTPKAGDVLYISNCGIVLLHPFLETYFAELDLIKDKQFVNQEARNHSVMLLYYLATGKTQMPEYDLLLQKILCAMPFEETLPFEIDLLEKEITESRKLLQTVTAYWPPLKNTSAEGFRYTFLQREGRLEKKESGWMLTVEQKTVDVLLGKLPWGYATIKLPWMNDILNVDWY